jgi:hypothetical protein
MADIRHFFSPFFAICAAGFVCFVVNQQDIELSQNGMPYASP